MATLLKAISNSDTTLMISADSSIPSAAGVIKIDSEIITYDNNYLGTLYGCVRGAQSTSAASHSLGASLTLVDFYHGVAGETGSFTTVTLTGATASRALTTDSSKVIVVSATTDTELGYVSGVTSAIQTQMNTKAPSASPTFTGTVTTPATALRALVTGASSELLASSVTSTELGYVSGVTSALQTQINTKSPSASPTFTGTVTTPVTASRALVTGASSQLAASAVTATELGYVAGVTSAIQTQINALPVVTVVSADPGSPTEGQVWYNTTTHLLKFYNGTAVKTVVSA